MVAIAVMNYPMSLGTGQHGAIIKSIIFQIGSANECTLESEIASQNLDWVVLPDLNASQSLDRI